jgi:mannose-6-phosphate isomerase
MSAARQSYLAALAPFRVEPRYVARVWGYRDLRPWFDRTADEQPIGEVWLTGDNCPVATGPYAGKGLGDLFAEQAAALLGAALPPAAAPLLIKVLFAKEKLSVQVHPGDAMARKYSQPRGKTECWYALAAEPGAQVAVGLKEGVTQDQVEEGIGAGTLEDSLSLLPVESGDTIFVDAGTVHAVWPGSILLETQQDSDATYRMYDYGRGRELHIERSLEAMRLTTRAGKVAPRALADRTLLIDCEYFRMERIAVTGKRTSASLRGPGKETPPGLAYLFAAAGAGRICGAWFEPVDLPPRGMVVAPAAAPEFEIESRDGDQGGLELIRITPNWPGFPATGLGRRGGWPGDTP